jgi:hypothetical protein
VSGGWRHGTEKKKGFICSPPPPPISYSLKSSLRISLLLASTNQLASRTEQAKLFSDEVRYGPNFPFLSVITHRLLTDASPVF